MADASSRTRYGSTVAFGEMAKPFPALRGTKVLVAEDERWIRECLRAHLAQHGCFTVGCDSVETARVALRVNSFEVVVLDLRLKDGTADELLPDIRAGGGPAPVVLVVTALTDAATIREWHERGIRLLLKFDLSAPRFVGLVEQAVLQYRDRVCAMAFAQHAERGPLAKLDCLPEAPTFRDLTGEVICWDEVRRRYFDLLGSDVAVSDLCLECLRLALAGVPLREIGGELRPPIKEDAVKKRLARVRAPTGAATIDELARMLRVTRLRGTIG